MAKIRSIHPETCESDKLLQLSDGAERTLWRLATHADDDGRGVDNAQLIASKCYPIDNSKDAAVVDEHLDELVKAGMLVRYVVRGKRYYEIHDFTDWQRPRHRTDSKFPPPSEGQPTPAPPSVEDVGRTSDAPPTDVGHASEDRPANGVGGGDGVGDGGGGGGGEPSPRKRSDRACRLPDDWRPTPEPELVEAIGGQGAAAREFAKFGDYWRAKAGKDSTKLDWQATWRNWLRRAGEDKGYRRRDGPDPTATDDLDEHGTARGIV